jgi:hypothetical protein
MPSLEKKAEFLAVKSVGIYNYRSALKMNIWSNKGRCVNVFLILLCKTPLCLYRHIKNTIYDVIFIDYNGVSTWRQ